MTVSELFLTMCNMSISAGWLVIAVVLVRQLLKKAPKTISLFLWALVAWRLICPIAPESILSLLPSGETIPQEIIYMETPAVDIDRDGKTEYCTLRVGPTSGMYTFYLTVDDMMYLYYSRTFVKGFDTNAKGQTVIVQENGNNGKTQEIVMVMQDGKVDLVGGNDLVLSGKTAIIAPETLFNHNHP